MITQKPWFGPRRLGYGWTPITPEGWLAVGGAIACVLASVVALPAGWAAPAGLTVSAALCGVCWLTSGPPGHQRARVRGRSTNDRKRIYRETHPEDPSIGEALGRFDGPRDADPGGLPPDLR